VLCWCPHRFALFTRADVAQKLPGIDSQFVSVVEEEADSVFADGSGLGGLGGGLEHGERAGSLFGGIAGIASLLGALVVAHRAGARIPQKDKRIVRLMVVFPFNIHARASGQVDLHRLGICRGLHAESIAQCGGGEPNAGSQPRRGERMQPTAQAVGDETEWRCSPKGAKDSDLEGLHRFRRFALYRFL
jgi:hypothetical protein